MDREPIRISHGKVEVDEKAIAYSKYCVKCFPNKERAPYTYKGNSLCSMHFEWEIKGDTDE